MKNPWLKLTGIGLAGLLGLGAPAAALADDAGSKFTSIDTNGDGQISAVEFEAVTDRKFVEIDVNRDGRVTAMEIDNYRAKAHKNKEKTDKGWDKTYSSAAQVKSLDTNGDGSLTEVEFEAGGQIKFDEMDTNHDGYLSKSEFEAGHAKAQKAGK